MILSVSTPYRHTSWRKTTVLIVSSREIIGASISKGGPFNSKMTATEKPFSEIKVIDPEKLVELEIPEGKEIEYNEFLDLFTDVDDHEEQ
jgi:hypothetical protein